MRSPTCDGLGTVSRWRKPGLDVIDGQQILCPTCAGAGRAPDYGTRPTGPSSALATSRTISTSTKDGTAGPG